MAFDLEVSVKLAGFNPRGMHVGRAGQMQASQPWAALEQRCSLVIQLVSTSSHICELTYQAVALLLFPSLFVNLSRLFHYKFFFSLSLSASEFSALKVII